MDTSAFEGDVDPSQVRTQLDGVLKSVSFSGAARLQEMLTYVVEEVLAGRGSELKETVIGREVFDRSGHDPRLDSIVRVTCSKLRAKLREYYLTEGMNDTLEIEFPRGGYAPVFRLRTRPTSIAPAPLVRRVPRLAWGILAGCVTAGCLAAFFWPSSHGRKLETIRFQVQPPPDASFLGFPVAGRVLVSPDGRKLAASVAEQGAGRILIRSFDSLSSGLLPAPARMLLLAWSPDSRSLLFFSDGRLWRIEATGGSPLEIAAAQNVRSAAWGPRGQIVFCSSGNSGLFQVSLSGTKAALLTDPDRKMGEVQHCHPYFLPGGDDLLYTAVNADETQSAIYRISLRNPNARTAVVKARSNAEVLTLPDGHSYLLYAQDRALVAHPLDLARRAVSGEPFVLAQGVSYYPFHSDADFSTANEIVAYRTAAVTQARKLVLMDRAGKTLAEGAGLGVERYPRISPDGKSLAVERLALDSAAGDLWVAPLERPDAANRLTQDTVGSYSPVWSPDSQYVVYGSRRPQGSGIFRKSLRDGVEQIVTRMEGSPTDFSQNGEWVLFNHEASETSHDIWLTRADGHGAPEVFRQTRHDEMDARFDPSGQWVAYCTNESGAWEVYVERFRPRDAERTHVHVSTGTSPSWTKSGREIVFHDKGSMFAVDWLPGDGVRFSEPKKLFSTGQYFHRGFGYHVSADGEKFLFSAPVESRSTDNSGIGVVIWK